MPEGRKNQCSTGMWKDIPNGHVNYCESPNRIRYMWNLIHDIGRSQIYGKNLAHSEKWYWDHWITRQFRGRKENLLTSYTMIINKTHIKLLQMKKTLETKKYTWWDNSILDTRKRRLVIYWQSSKKLCKIIHEDWEKRASQWRVGLKTSNIALHWNPKKRRKRNRTNMWRMVKFFPNVLKIITL